MVAVDRHGTLGELSLAVRTEALGARLREMHYRVFTLWGEEASGATLASVIKAVVRRSSPADAAAYLGALERALGRGDWVALARAVERDLPIVLEAHAVMLAARLVNAWWRDLSPERGPVPTERGVEAALRLRLGVVPDPWAWLAAVESTLTLEGFLAAMKLVDATRLEP